MAAVVRKPRLLTPPLSVFPPLYPPSNSVGQLVCLRCFLSASSYIIPTVCAAEEELNEALDKAELEVEQALTGRTNAELQCEAARADYTRLRVEFETLETSSVAETARLAADLAASEALASAGQAAAQAAEESAAAVRLELTSLRERALADTTQVGETEEALADQAAEVQALRQQLESATSALAQTEAALEVGGSILLNTTVHTAQGARGGGRVPHVRAMKGVRHCVVCVCPLRLTW